MYYALNLSEYPTVDAAFATIPKGTVCLGLPWNGLSQKSAFMLAAIFRKIPSDISELDLGYNALYRTPGDDLALAFRAMPPHVKTLDLSANHLYLKTASDWALMFSGLSLHIRRVNLCKNKLYRKPYMAILFGALFIFWGCLLLNGVCRYFTLTVNSHLWSLLFASVQTICLVKLVADRMCIRDPESLIQLLRTIPETVKHIDLRENQLFSRKKASAIDALLGALGDMRMRLDLSHNGESDFARAVAPLASMVSARQINTDVGTHIISFFGSKAQCNTSTQIDQHNERIYAYSALA